MTGKKYISVRLHATEEQLRSIKAAAELAGIGFYDFITQAALARTKEVFLTTVSAKTDDSLCKETATNG